MNLRKAQVNDVLKKMQDARRLDLCFLVDVTGSMTAHIRAVKESIRSIVGKLTTKPTIGTQSIVQQFRLAFVGYRDYGDIRRFEVLNFTESVDDFCKFCTTIIATGGYDATEDVFGGIEKALALNWTIDGSTRILFHIADWPCHGRQFHSFNHSAHYDRYPTGDPSGRSISSLFEQINRREIYYNFGRITSHTDIMLEKFSTFYNGEIAICDVKDANHILDNVISVTSMAVTRVGKFPGRPKLPKLDTAFDESEGEPDWKALPVINALLLSYECPSSLDDVIKNVPLKLKQPVKAMVKITKNTFAKGVERVAYFGRILISKTREIEIVFKKYIGEKGFLNNVVHYKTSIQLQTIAAYMASKFTIELMDKVGSGYAIKFLKGQMLSYVDEHKMRVYMSCERRYPMRNDYIHFTNNVDYAMHETTANLKGVDMKSVEHLIAFSHWTFQVTRGYLMVVDLQGVIHTDAEGHKSIVLTDPAIHCKDSLRFGKTNFGEKGMKAFFDRHDCNEICRKLGLVVPSSSEGEKKFSIIDDGDL